ncbi:hypothetical protein K443DRAFT_89836, partial [Laccaria amethystina LaAM-08-1]
RLDYLRDFVDGKDTMTLGYHEDAHQGEYVAQSNMRLRSSWLPGSAGQAKPTSAYLITASRY